MLSALDPTLLLVLNLFGTVAFALSGAMAGVRARLDVFGVLVMAFVVGLAGGIARDLVLGIPAQSVKDWRFILAVLAAGLAVAIAHPVLERMSRPVEFLDACGLAIFCVSGAAVALRHDANVGEAIILGMITAIGGGVVRDMLLTEVPIVLRRGLYAVPAALGAGVIVLADAAGANSVLWPALGAAACLALRLVGLRFDINLPRPAGRER